jgi:hypothetical protein
MKFANLLFVFALTSLVPVVATAQAKQGLCAQYSNCVTGSAVPDLVAYRVIINAISLSDNPAASEIDLQHRLVFSMGLTQEDALALASLFTSNHHRANALSLFDQDSSMPSSIALNVTHS